MSFATVMFLWSTIFVAVVIVFIYSTFSRKNINEEGNVPSKSIFDFSTSQQEEEQLKRTLTEAIASSKTENDFQFQFKSLTKASTGLDGELAWAWLNRSLVEYRRADDFDVDLRVLAERFVKDITTRYGLGE